MKRKKSPFKISKIIFDIMLQLLIFHTQLIAIASESRQIEFAYDRTIFLT